MQEKTEGMVDQNCSNKNQVNTLAKGRSKRISKLIKYYRCRGVKIEILCVVWGLFKKK